MPRSRAELEQAMQAEGRRAFGGFVGPATLAARQRQSKEEQSAEQAEKEEPEAKKESEAEKAPGLLDILAKEEFLRKGKKRKAEPEQADEEEREEKKRKRARPEAEPAACNIVLVRPEAPKPRKTYYTADKDLRK